MKKRIVIVVMLLMFGLLYNAMAAPVSVEKAGAIAVNALFEKDARSLEMKNISEVFIEKEGAENVYYVFNFDPEGWVILSADDVAYPVIGYSEKGSYSKEKLPPAFDEWMNRVKQEIHHAVVNGLSPLPNAAEKWKHLDTSPEKFRRQPTKRYTPGGTPLIAAKWHQNSPWNSYCPVDASDRRAVAGCVAVAMAQVMRYHAYPTTGIGSHSYTPSNPEYGVQSVNFGATTYSWDDMPLVGSSASSSSAVQELLYHCGVSVDMAYGT